ncbi:MAG: hypothetical protein WAM28_06435 [Chlamydiales bacterium]
MEEQLNQLTFEERKSLEYFFSIAIKKDHLGHVLFFSDKPACLIGANASSNQSKQDALFTEGWKVWKEKEHLFPHPNFLIFHEIVDFGDNNSALHIYFINKKTLSNLISKNEEFFNEFKDCYLSNLEKNKIDSLADADQAFVGVLLGYGIEASKAYKYNKIKKNPKDSTLELILCAKDGEVTLNKRASNTRYSLTCVVDKEVNVLPVTFLGNPSSKEVQMLQKKYTEQRSEIEAIFRKKELLKTALKALCETR